MRKLRGRETRQRELATPRCNPQESSQARTRPAGRRTFCEIIAPWRPAEATMLGAQGQVACKHYPRTARGQARSASTCCARLTAHHFCIAALTARIRRRLDGPLLSLRVSAADTSHRGQAQDFFGRLVSSAPGMAGTRARCRLAARCVSVTSWWVCAN